MKKFIYLSLIIFIYSCSENKTEANDKKIIISKVTTSVKNTQEKINIQKKQEQTDHKNFDPKKDSDKNKDGIINFKDWEKTDKNEKYKIIAYYNDLTNQSLGLYPSKEIREKEINSIINKITKIYSSNNNDQKYMDIYELILSFN